MSTNLSQWFDLDNNGTDVRTEVLAGITTFVASMYIITTNPTILQKAGMPFSAVLTATVLVSALSSITMGLYARNPLLVAPGMSLNALMVVSVVQTEGIPWRTALGCIFWAGMIFSPDPPGQEEARTVGGPTHAQIWAGGRHRPLHSHDRV